MMYRVLRRTIKTSRQKFDSGELFSEEDIDLEPRKRQRLLDKLVDIGRIVEVDTEAPTHLGAGWYLLPNGEKVRGRDAAFTEVIHGIHDQKSQPL